MILLRLTILKKKKTISSMKNNKATKHPAPDSIPIEFYKALFCNGRIALETYPAAGKCLKLIF